MSATFEGETRVELDIQDNTFPYDFISQIQQRSAGRIFNPHEDDEATENLLAQRGAWAETGCVTIFTSGAYDMLHQDHRGYLLHTKSLGAEIHYERKAAAGYADDSHWRDLTPEQQLNYAEFALGSGSLKLIVSVDGDKSVAAKKNGKGGAPRPIYGWQTRANTVAQEAFVDPYGLNRLLPTADAVTMHGPADFTDDPESIHASHFSLVAALKPDVWAFYGESTEIPEIAPTIAGLHSVAMRRIADGAGTHYYEDPLIGKMSTTSIVKRILGAQD